jgi:hypothetical protein
MINIKDFHEKEESLLFNVYKEIEKNNKFIFIVSIKLKKMLFFKIILLIIYKNITIKMIFIK